MSDNRKGYSLVITSSFLTGCIYTLGKVAMSEVSPTLLIAWTFSIASIVLFGWTIADGRWREIFQCSFIDWVYILGFTAFSIAALAAMWSGIQHLDPTVASFLGRLQTVVAVLLGVLFLKERFGYLEALGGAILIAGVVVIRISFDVSLSRWFWVMVASGVMFGVTEVLAKQAVKRIHPVPLNFVRNLFISIFFILWLCKQEKGFFEVGESWWYLVAIALMGPLGSRQLFLFALKYIDVSKAVLINQIQPIFVYLIAFTTLGMVPTLREWIGGALILVGSISLIRGRKQPQMEKFEIGGK